MPEEIPLQIHGEGIESHEISAPPSIEAGEFVRELVAGLRLSEVGDDGRPIVWEVNDKQTGHALSLGRTLHENGVRAGHHLYLHRKTAQRPVPPPPDPLPLPPVSQPSKIPLLIAIALIPIVALGSYFLTSKQKQQQLEVAVTAANQRTSAAEAQAAQAQQKLDEVEQKASAQTSSRRDQDDSRQAQLKASEARIIQLRAAAAHDQNQIKGLQATVQSLQATVQSLQTRPRYGWLTWTGDIPKGNVVEIRDNRPTVGSLSGGKLPGADCTVEAPDPERVSIEAHPDASTAWNRIIFRVKGNGRTTVHLLWVIK